MAPKQTSPAPIAPRRQLQSHHLTVAQHLHQNYMILVLLHHVGNRFQVLLYTEDAGKLDAATVAALQQLAGDSIAAHALVLARTGQAPAGLPTLLDSKGRLAERYDLQDGTTYLTRPDQHVAARWRQFDAGKVRAAIARATGNA